MADPSLLPVLSSEVSTSSTLTRRQRWVDLFFVIGVTVLPAILWSAYYAVHLERLQVYIGSSMESVSRISTYVAGLAVLFYVLWKRGSDASAFGKAMKGADLFRGIAIWAIATFVAATAAVTFDMIYQHVHGHLPQGGLDLAAMLDHRFGAVLIVVLFINPWFEELIVRGFLMTELTQLTNATVAIVMSTAVQASYHLYAGSWGMVQLVPMFLLYSIYYARTRRLFPVIVAHTLADFTPLLLYAFRHRAH
jgi:membrane protease YdiL (CAAX protease family)